MGLSVCRSIVEAHNGKMWVESSPGAGATFFFEVPAARNGAIAIAMTAEERAVPPRSTDQADATVLVVDDDPAVRAAVARLVRQAWLEGMAIRFPMQAPRHAPHRWNGVRLVLDVQMPGMSGPHFHDRMSERGLDFPVVYLTGHGDLPARRARHEEGCSGFPAEAGR